MLLTRFAGHIARWIDQHHGRTPSSKAEGNLEGRAELKQEQSK